MIKMELELAIRLTVDLSRPVRSVELPLLERSLALAKDLSAMRGYSDPSIGLIETHLLALPIADEPASLFSPADLLERRQIIDALALAKSVREAAIMLGISRPTFYNRCRKYDIHHDLGHRKPLEAAS